MRFALCFQGKTSSSPPAPLPVLALSSSLLLFLLSAVSLGAEFLLQGRFRRYAGMTITGTVLSYSCPGERVFRCSSLCLSLPTCIGFNAVGISNATVFSSSSTSVAMTTGVVCQFLSSASGVSSVVGQVRHDAYVSDHVTNISVLSLDPCASTPCLNSGTCQRVPSSSSGTYVCNCTLGTTGTNCESSGNTLVT